MYELLHFFFLVKCKYTRMNYAKNLIKQNHIQCLFSFMAEKEVHSYFCPSYYLLGHVPGVRVISALNTSGSFITH